LAQEVLAGVEPERARAGDASDFAMARVLGRGDPIGIGAW
jgi:hypothetical protein